MKKFQKTKGFVVGTLVTLLIAYALTPALAETVDVVFNSINIRINGSQLATIGQSYNPGSGDLVPYTINYKGTVYLPLRKLGEVYDKEINWDGNTNTALIDDKFTLPSPTPIPLPTPTDIPLPTAIPMPTEIPQPTEIPTPTPILTPTPTPAPDVSPTPTPIPSSYTRSNPAPFGIPQQITHEQTDNNAVIWVTLDRMLRGVNGVDAWDLLIKEDPFNKPAAEGYEYIVVQLSIGVVSTESVKPFNPNTMNIKCISSDNMEYPKVSGVRITTLKDLFPDGMYKDATKTGYMIFQVAKTDLRPTIVIGETSQNAGYWFRLY